MKIDDDLLESLGEKYRIGCGSNDVLIKDRWVVHFMDFLRWAIDRRNGGQVRGFDAFVRWYLLPQGRQRISA